MRFQVVRSAIDGTFLNFYKRGFTKFCEIPLQERGTLMHIQENSIFKNFSPTFFANEILSLIFTCKILGTWQSSVTIMKSFVNVLHWCSFLSNLCICLKYPCEDLLLKIRSINQKNIDHWKSAS